MKDVDVIKRRQISHPRVCVSISNDVPGVF
jgi:hypothetical protein